MVVERLFLTVPWGCLRFVIVVFPDHTQANSFALRNIPVWNSLPTDTVNSKTVVDFKTKLDEA